LSSSPNARASLAGVRTALILGLFYGEFIAAGGVG
jgi:hypothetical protein